MNKKALWLILAFLTFFGIKSAAFASVTYDLVEKKIYLSINAKNVTTAQLSCDDGAYVKSVGNTGSADSNFNATLSFSELGIGDGEHYCALTYNYDKNGTIKGKNDTKKTLIYIMEPNNSAADCSSTSISQNDCKKRGCLSKGNNYCAPYNVASINNGNNSSFEGSSGTEHSGSGGSFSTTTSSNSTNLDRNDNEPFDASTFCYDIKAGLRIVGITILMIKIIVPLAIILMGSFDFYKTVSSGKNEDLKKDAIMVGKRVLTGLIIFFLPTIIKTTVNILDDDMDADYHYCINCLFDPLNTCDD